MGRDKALLPFRGTVLAAHVAGLVAGAAGSATLIGDPGKYNSLGFPVVADLRPGEGPLAGIESALASSWSEWNLVVACDMPGLTPELLAEAMKRAEDSLGECVVPRSESGRLEYLCAVWRRSCLPAVRRALNLQRRAVKDLLPRLSLEVWEPAGHEWSRNINTPEEWARHGRIGRAEDE
jgi:molybdopterin-guanine dinucleotide biosynthesis protein A